MIGFLESNGDKQVYWRILGEHNITRERLASYERKITAEPYMVHTNIGELINDFRAYLSILKDVHDALDIKVRSVSLLERENDLFVFVHLASFLDVTSFSLVSWRISLVDHTLFSGDFLLSTSLVSAYIQTACVCVDTRRPRATYTATYIHI